MSPTIMPLVQTKVGKEMSPRKGLEPPRDPGGAKPIHVGKEISPRKGLEHAVSSGLKISLYISRKGNKPEKGIGTTAASQSKKR